MRCFTILLVGLESSLTRTLRLSLKALAHKMSFQFSFLEHKPSGNNFIIKKGKIIDLLVITSDMDNKYHAGLEYVSRLRKNHPRIPFILTAQHPDLEGEKIARSLGGLLSVALISNHEQIVWSIISAANQMVENRPNLLKKSSHHLNIYSYSDYHQLLHDYYSGKKRLNPRYSMNILAKKLGYKTKGSIYAIIHNGVLIPLKMAVRFAQVMELGSDEICYFCALVGYCNAKSSSERNHYFQQLKHSNPDFKGLESATLSEKPAYHTVRSLSQTIRRRRRLPVRLSHP